MRIARVFPRRTRATPVDELAFYTEPPLFTDDIDEVHVSVTFTYDLAYAEYLARAWGRIAPTKIGGPAIGLPSGDFVPGMYLKKGYLITSRGCDNRCPDCFVWRREGNVHEIPITEGWNLLDDNLLNCRDEHIREVFAMLATQSRPVEFTGGLEAARLKRWHVEELAKLKPKQMFFAYDTPDDWDPLVDAMKLLLEAGFTAASHKLRCYVLIGNDEDTMDNAAARLQAVKELGYFPMAMLFRDEEGRVDQDWRRFQRVWANPTIVGSAA